MKDKLSPMTELGVLIGYARIENGSTKVQHDKIDKFLNMAFDRLKVVSKNEKALQTENAHLREALQEVDQLSTILPNAWSKYSNILYRIHIKAQQAISGDRE